MKNSLDKKRFFFVTVYIVVSCVCVCALPCHAGSCCRCSYKVTYIQLPIDTRQSRLFFFLPIRPVLSCLKSNTEHYIFIRNAVTTPMSEAYPFSSLRIITCIRVFGWINKQIKPCVYPSRRFTCTCLCLFVCAACVFRRAYASAMR